MITDMLNSVATRPLGRWAVCLAALVSVPCAGTYGQDAPVGPTQNALAGSWVFGSKGCATCHSINDVGGTVGPDLGRVEQLRTYYDLAAAFWNHFPQMVDQMRELGVEPPHMNTREMGDLIAFLTSINYFDTPGDVDKGNAHFATMQCIRCHQVAGVGGVIGPSLDYLGNMGSPIQIATAMWNHGPAMAEAMQTLGIRRPSFGASELTDLVAFLKSASPGPPQGPMYVLPGRAQLGRRWFVEKGCLECHNIRGRGGSRAPDLARRGRQLSLSKFAATMWNKAPGMLRMMRTQGVNVPQLEVSQMADILAYLYSVRYFQRLGDAAAGRRLVQRRGCLNCHSIGGRGEKSGTDLAKVKGLTSAPAVIAVMWNHGRVMTEEAEGRFMWPTLLPVEMADMSAFFVESSSK
jgi:cytochrome c2